MSATLRYQPTTITLSLSNPQMQYAYLDADSDNAQYPTASAFDTWINTANPNLTKACASIATVSDAVITPSSVSGAIAPTEVVSYYPKIVGTCTQTVNLGLGRTGKITVVVTQ